MWNDFCELQLKFLPFVVQYTILNHVCGLSIGYGGIIMAENKEYYTQKVENGSIQISEDVVASVAAMAVMEQEGVCGLSTGIGSDIAEMLGMKSAAKGVRIVSDKEGRLFVECNVVANFGYSVFELAKNVQDAVRSSLESVTGLNVAKVNVNVCGIALPRESRK